MRGALDYIQAAAALATAIGVFLAAWQLTLAKRQATAQFEDQLTAQYREIIRRIPVGALLNGSLSEEEHQANLAGFYHYFDLSNEQAFLRRIGRVSDKTWNDWEEGIAQNLQRPAFGRAWDEISNRSPDSFDDLREIVKRVTSGADRASGSTEGPQSALSAWVQRAIPRLRVRNRRVSHTNTSGSQSMVDRPYIDLTIDQLEKLVAENRFKVAVLGPIRVELEHRTTPRAKQLLKEVLALVEGQIPPPKPPRAGRPSDQRSFFSPDSGGSRQE